MHLTRELARAERLKQEVALLVMDLDNFKSINDSHGHHVGDRALCEVARVLRTAIRPYDICVRYAGDEFIVVLSGCNTEEAESKRAELQQSIDEVFFEARPGKRVELGISVGGAVFPQDGESYEALLAMEKVGRDRVSVVVPSLTMLAEPPVAVVDRVVDRRGTRTVAEAYLQFLYTPEAQEIAARHYYRPRLAEVLARHRSQFPEVRTLAIGNDFGGWASAQREHFDEGGVFDRIFTRR
jgi:diguanylate cyclase (GGDEF)-like protein